MNTQSFERQLQQLTPPAPDPEARLRARRAAIDEFERIHHHAPRATVHRRWTLPRLWIGGLATACVVVLGVSVVWRMPATDRAIAPETARPAHRPAMTEQQAAAQQVPATASNPAATAATGPTATTTAQASTRATSRVASPSASPPVQAPPVLKAELPPVPAPAAAGERSASTPGPLDVVTPGAIPPGLLKRMDVVTGGAAATAKDGDTELAEVQTTGTRIQEPRVAGANPVTSMSAEQMQRLGIVNVADALTQLVPQNTVGPPTVIIAETTTERRPPAGGAPDGGSFFIGNTVANLRGMDPAFGGRTLTLVDGRRVVSASNQADVVDLNIGQPANSEKFASFEVNPVKRVADEPRSTFSIDVDTSSYSFVRRRLEEGVLPSADMVRTEEMLNYFGYDWPGTQSRDQPFKPTVTVSDSPWNKGRKLVHIGIKGYELPARQRPDVNLVLLLDVSGSMNSPDKLPLAQRSMAMLLDSLKPTDTVGITVYAGAAGEVLPPTPVRRKEQILQALYSLRPGGSTAGAAGIRQAYEMASRNFRKGGVNRILLATDGDFNVGINDPDELKKFVEQQRQKGIYLSVLGFGEGNYRDDTAQALAQNGNGVAAYIDSINEARKVLVQQAGAQLFTIAKDVKLQVEFNPATVSEYRLVGYETRALRREDFNNDRVDAGDVGAGHTVTAIYEITPVGVPGALADESRYADGGKPAATNGRTDEYGYLRIRYKLPDEDESKLIEQPIAVKAGVPGALKQDVAFATAVAGFAQLLQGGRYTGSLGYDDVYRQAQGAMGEDADGYRAEFLHLVRRAQALSKR
jgi:Ca-activated chloride channel family protein